MQTLIREMRSMVVKEEKLYGKYLEKQEEKYVYWLASIRNLTHMKKREILLKVNNIEEIYDVEFLKKHPFIGLSDTEIEILQLAKKSWDLEREYSKLQEKEIKMVSCLQSKYPMRLRPYQDAPFALFYKGELPEEERKTVAIVGARRCSPYGEKYASEYAQLLARCGVQVISGLAKGIDGIAQRATLEAGGTSFGVLGSGIDICYPREHIGLYHDLTEQGGVISELPLGIQPLPLHFPLRNRIISGLSDAVIIIEAKERSGSLITADLALEQGKEVYALPGMVSSELSKGCHELIKQGAGLLNNPTEFMQEMGICEQITSRKTKENKKVLETKEKLVYSCLCVDAKPIDWILSRSQLSIQEVVNILVSLELKGYAKEISRNYYVKL